MLYSPYAIPPTDHGEDLVSTASYSAKSSGWDTSGSYVYTRGYDGNEGTETHGASSEQWFEFTVTAAQTITYARVFEDNSGASSLGEWKISYLDGTVWKDAFNYRPANAAGWHEPDFAHVPNVKKVRFYGKPPAGSNVEVYEVRFLRFGGEGCYKTNSHANAKQERSAIRSRV